MTNRRSFLTGMAGAAFAAPFFFAATRSAGVNPGRLATFDTIPVGRKPDLGVFESDFETVTLEPEDGGSDLSDVIYRIEPAGVSPLLNLVK